MPVNDADGAELPSMIPATKAGGSSPSHAAFSFAPNATPVPEFHPPFGYSFHLVGISMMYEFAVQF